MVAQSHFTGSQAEDLTHVLVPSQDEGRYKAQTRLPFNAFGTIAMAREVSRLLSEAFLNLRQIQIKSDRTELSASCGMCS